MSKNILFRLASLILIIAISLFMVGCGGSSDDWVFGSDHEYSTRDDGYMGLQELYGFEFDDVAVMDLGITYSALREGEVNVALGFATDGRIAAFDLVNLEDDMQFHPVYNCSPVVREETLEMYPEIADILNPVAAALDTETMSGMNKKVDIDEYIASEVAEEWLLEQGFIGDDPAELGTGDPVSVGSKEFTEQLILGQITILALEYNGIPTVDNTGLGGTVVVREAQEGGEVDLYWEYTGTALISHLGFDEAITDPEECYAVVSETDLEQNGLVWLDYTPFDNTYTLMMRQEDADELGIVTISDLAEAINSGVPSP
jgi:osmoprotectant transport system substrate-binding protein